MLESTAGAQDAAGSGQDAAELVAIADMEGLLARGLSFLDELQAFEVLLRTNRYEVPGLRYMRSKVKDELPGHRRVLDDFKPRIADPNGDESTGGGPHSGAEPQQHNPARDSDRASALKTVRTRVSCSNIPSSEAHWGAIKRCRALRSVSQFYPHRVVEAGKLPRVSGEGRPPTTGSSNGKPTSASASRTVRRRPVGKLNGTAGAGRDCALVDAVVDGGREWLRVLTLPENRLLSEMAMAGWDWGGGGEGEGEEEEEEEEEAAGGGGGGDDDDEGDAEVSVVRTVKRLVRAARVHPHNGHSPRLHIVLNRIREGAEPEIDRLLRKLRNLGGGATGSSTGNSNSTNTTKGKDVDTPISIRVSALGSPFLSTPPPALRQALDALLPRSRGESDLTGTLNLDCSTLIALASDISHSRVAVEGWMREDVRRQIRAEEEAEGGAVPTLVYPLLRGRDLVCAGAVARRVWEIVGLLGTESEVARATVLLPGGPGFGGWGGGAGREVGSEPERGQGQEWEQDQGHSRVSSNGAAACEREDALAQMRRLSIYPVPSDLRLPVRVIDARMSERWRVLAESGRLPGRLVEAVVPEFRDEVNLEAFLYGWSEAIATVTANGALDKVLRRRVEECNRAVARPGRGDEQEGVEEEEEKGELRGPLLCVHPVTRAMVSKGSPEGKVTWKKHCNRRVQMGKEGEEKGCVGEEGGG